MLKKDDAYEVARSIKMNALSEDVEYAKIEFQSNGAKKMLVVTVIIPYED